MHVAVETADGPTLGRTVVGRRGTAGNEPNASVAVGIDADGFFRLLTERLARNKGDSIPISANSRK